MIVFLAILGGIALAMLLPLVAALVGIYNAFWAAKIWALLVVPTFDFPPLPMAGAVGLALTFMAMRPRTTSNDDDKDKSTGVRVTTSLVLALIAAPLTYAVAWVAAKILL